MPITTTQELTSFLNSIQMLGTRFEDWKFRWVVTEVHDPENDGWMIRCSFERPDVNGQFNDQGVGFGRKWFVARDSSETGVVFTAWLAIQQIITHELHESFTVEVGGERVRLLDPHKELADLAIGSRRIP